MMSNVPVNEPPVGVERRAPVVLALDIGTSSVRGALFDEFGNEIPGTEARLVRHLCTTLDGGAELNADESVEQVARTVDAVIGKAPSRSVVIEAVAVSCFWHSLVGLSSRASAMTPVFGWADTRAARAAEELRHRFDEREVHARTGCRFHASYWPARLRWLQQERADLYRAVARWMSFGELLTDRFFGETEASISMASGTGLLNQRSGAWDDELLAWLGMIAEQLPPVAEANKSFTGLRGEYARRWPMLHGARWFPAIGDGAANNLGVGCITRERAALMIGTSGAMRVLWEEDEAPAPPPPGLWRYRADSRRVVIGGALSDGGGLYGWMMEALALGGNREEVESALVAVEPDAHGLTILPFWAGERSTGWCARARGAILGLTMHTRAIEILRAAMESVAYRFALIAGELDTVAPGAALVASGGALRASGVWAQMLADVLGRPLTLSGVRESSSRGAVLLALEAAGKIKSIAGVPAPLDVIYEPDMARHARYRAGLERQQSIYQHLIADQEVARKIGEAAQERKSEDERRCQSLE